jgi:hypothetical protein
MTMTPTEKLERELFEALRDLMSEPRFMALSEAQALQIGIEVSEMWSARLFELEEEDDGPLLPGPAGGF